MCHEHIALRFGNEKTLFIMLEITPIHLADYLPSDLKGTIQLEQLVYILSDAHDFLLEVTEAIPPHVIPAMFVTQDLPSDSGGAVLWLTQG